MFALDAATGRLLWQHKPMAPRPARAGGQTFLLNRGVAVSDGKVFYGSTDNFLVALDQKTGREVWRVAIDDSKQCGCNVTSAPLVVKTKVIVGGTGGELAHRGYLTGERISKLMTLARYYALETGHGLAIRKAAT